MFGLEVRLGGPWRGVFGLEVRLAVQGCGWGGAISKWNGQVFKIPLLSVTSRTPGLGDIRQTQRP